MREKLTVIFPVEIIVRELDFRLLLASLWAKPHHRIFLAHSSHATRIATKLRGGGLYVGKNMGPTPTYSVPYYQAKENGFVLLHLDEEGAVFMGDETSWGINLDLQLNPALLSKEDRVATWGDFQRDYYLSRAAPNLRQIRTTGHPRFEIYKNFKAIYAEEAEKIKQRFGRFVLFNSNMGWAVNPLGYSDTFSDYMGYCPHDEVKRLCFVDRWARQMRVFPEFIQLLHRLSIKRKDLNFVVRPHPSDSLRDFQDIFRDIPNIHVVREGSVVPWILASSVMLHDGCTTGIEAYMMGKPVVNFTPVKSEHEIFLPNLLGVRAWSQAEAEAAIIDLIDRNPGSIEIPERAHKIFANFRNDSMKLFLEMLDEAEAVSPRTNDGLTMRLMADQAQDFVTEQAKQIARRLLFKRHYLSSQIVRVLFPGFDRAYIRSRLDSIAELTGRSLEMKWFSPWLVELNSKESSNGNPKRH